MRFKSIFWLFNIAAAAAIILITVLSFIILGDRSFALMFWGNMWMLMSVFLVLIAALDFYFIRNWKLFDYLEKEDWPSLLAWLEERLYTRGRLNRAHAGLLINTALSVSNFDAVRKLEMEVRRRNPKLMHHIGVSLGIPVLLKKSDDEVSAYFTPLADDPATHRRDWAQWCRASAAGRDGVDELMGLMDGRDLSIRLLSDHLLEQYEDQFSAKQKTLRDEARTRLKADARGTAGDRQLQRSRESHLLAVVMSSRVDRIRGGLQGGPQ